MNIQTEIKTTLKLSLPMAASQLAQFSLHMIDTLMCGQLGSLALAGAGLGSTLFAMLWLPASGILSAVSPLCAHGYGAQDHESIQKTVHQALLFALCLALPLFLLLSYGPVILTWLGQPKTLTLQAGQYLQAVRWGILPAMGVTILRGLMESLGRPRPALLISISGIFINIFANWTLMFGNFGFPALGIAGTGWATTCVNLWIFCCLLIWILRDPKLSPYLRLFPFFKIEKKILRELLKIGLPMGGGILTEVWLFTGTTFLMGHFGSIALAAHQIALNIASASFMIALGVANASTVRVAQAMGRGQVSKAQEAGWIGILLGMLFMGGVGLLLWNAPQLLIGLYIKTDLPANQALLILSISLLKIAALFQLFDALQVTSQGALRGMKDTRIPMWIGFFCYGGIGLGSALFFAHVLHWREKGLWAGLTLGLLTAGLTLSLRFQSHFRSLKI